MQCRTFVPPSSAHTTSINSWAESPGAFLRTCRKIDVRIAPRLVVETSTIADVQVSAITGELEPARVEEVDFVALGVGAEADLKWQLIVRVLGALELHLGVLVVVDQNVLGRILGHELIDCLPDPNVLHVFVCCDRSLQSKS